MPTRRVDAPQGLAGALAGSCDFASGIEQTRERVGGWHRAQLPPLRESAIQSTDEKVVLFAPEITLTAKSSPLASRGRIVDQPYMIQILEVLSESAVIRPECQILTVWGNRGKLRS